MRNVYSVAAVYGVCLRVRGMVVNIYKHQHNICIYITSTTYTTINMNDVWRLYEDEFMKMKPYLDER